MTSTPQRRTALVWGVLCVLMAQFLQLEGSTFMPLECEMLPVHDCAFAVGVGGFRCVLETAAHLDGYVTYECQTLRMEMQMQVGADSSTRSGYIETDECINTCGLQRLTVGISTDDILHNSLFREKLCSPKCKQNCLNIVDHYNTIMAEEGEDLTRVCDELREYDQANREREKEIANAASREREKRQVIRQQSQRSGVLQRDNTSNDSTSNKHDHAPHKHTPVRDDNLHDRERGESFRSSVRAFVRAAAAPTSSFP